jgi:hypothetical protein
LRAGGAVTLDTVLDYTAWLQDVDEDSDEPRCHPRTVAKQLSALRGFARWLSMLPELRIDPRIQQIRVKAGPPPAPRALAPDQLDGEAQPVVIATATTDETQIAVVEEEEALQLHPRRQPGEAAVPAGLGIREELDRHAFSTYRPASSRA